MDKKLGIIVPYRNRYEQLLTFKKSISEYLKKTNIKYELIIVEQDDAKLFNRGKLLNIGFLEAKKHKCNYITFHDVDMLPVNVDYSFSEYPIHLATNFTENKLINRLIFDEYFGGVTIFPIDIFEKINGYSNEYWGWGYEDNDLLYRCKINYVNLNQKEIKMMGGNTAALEFNGKDSYVQGKNIFNLNEPFTLFTSFYPNDLICNPDKYDDVFPIFSIPGYDFRITYDSYKRFSLTIFNDKNEVIFINSEIIDNYKTNITITIDPTKKTITMYQDGNVVGVETYNGNLYDYQSEENFFLGCANIDVKEKEDEKYFEGLISSFAVFNKVLSMSEIRELSKNQFFGLSSNFGNYRSSKNLITYYDAKFIRNGKLIDISGNNNDGTINNCELNSYNFDNIKVIEIPHRRKSTFKLLPHEENGYVGRGWKNITTRYNQMKFHNEVEKGEINTKEDGLSNCTYITHSNIKVGNQTHIIVGI